MLFENNLYFFLDFLLFQSESNTNAAFFEKQRRFRPEWLVAQVVSNFSVKQLYCVKQLLRENSCRRSGVQETYSELKTHYIPAASIDNELKWLLNNFAPFLDRATQATAVCIGNDSDDQESHLFGEDDLIRELEFKKIWINALSLHYWRNYFTMAHTTHFSDMAIHA